MALLSRTRLRSVFLDVVPVNDTVGEVHSLDRSFLVLLYHFKLPELGSAGKLAEKLRSFEIPVIAGASDDQVLFHVRTLSEKE